MIFRPEAVQVARWLEQPEHAAAREAFLAAYPDWKQRVGDTPAKLSALFSDGESAPLRGGARRGLEEGRPVRVQPRR